MNKKEIVEKFAAAYDNFEIKECCKYIHPEVKVRTLTSDKYSVEGIEKFADFYSSTFQKYPQQNTKLVQRMVFDDTVIDEEILYGRPEKPEGYHGFVIYAFRDGMIDRIWI